MDGATTGFIRGDNTPEVKDVHQSERIDRTIMIFIRRAVSQKKFLRLNATIPLPSATARISA